LVIPMKRVPGFLAVTFLALSLWFVVHPGLAGAQKATVQFKGVTMSATLSNVSLQAVLEGIEKEHGIWFETDVPLTGEKISLQFEDLPVEKGLKRILAGMNHILVFDAKKGDVVGVVIFGKKKTPASGPEGVRRTFAPEPASEPPKPPAREAAKKEYATPGPVEGTEEELKVFESVEEALPESELREGAVGEGEERASGEDEAAPQQKPAEATEEKEQGQKQEEEGEPATEAVKSD